MLYTSLLFLCLTWLFWLMFQVLLWTGIVLEGIFFLLLFLERNISSFPHKRFYQIMIRSSCTYFLQGFLSWMNVGFCQRLFSVPIKWSSKIFPCLCFCDVYHLFIYVYQVIPVSLGWNLMMIFKMNCCIFCQYVWRNFTSVFFKELDL